MKGLSASFRPSELFSAAIPGVVLGISFGFFIHGYWLVDLFPIGSKRLLYSTLFLCLLGAVIHTIVFIWLRMQWRSLLRRQFVTVTGLGIVIGLFVLFAATDNWLTPVRYVTLFLPERTLDVSISSMQRDGSAIELRWLSTSLGDVSFDDLDYEGWRRENRRLVLENYADNSLRWAGKTGEVVQFVLSASVEKSDIEVLWDGQAEKYFFQSPEYVLAHTFDIPFYASKAWILFLGGVNFIFLALPACFLIWGRRFEIWQSLQHAVEHTPGSVSKREGIVVLLVILLACVLRLPDLEGLPPLTDEYQQFNAAKQIIRGVPWQEVYPRSFWILTFPISLAFRMFGFEVWIARTVGVFFNVMALVPLYLISRKVNRSTAILAILLFATNPLLIGLSRVAREYAYYPFYFYWIVYGLIVVLDRVQGYFSGRGDWSYRLTARFLGLGLGLTLPLVYALYIDTFSTFKIIVIAYVMLGVLMIFMVNLKGYVRRATVLGVLIAASASVYVWSARFSLAPGFDATPVGYFLPNPPQQWYFDRTALIPALGLLASVFVGFLVRRKNIVPFFVVLLFTAFLGFFVFSSVGSREPRHLSVALLWYVILLAFGIHILWLCLRSLPFFRGRLAGYLVAITIVFASLNVPQVLLPITFHGSYLPVTRHYHPAFKPLHEYLLVNARTDGALISTNGYLWYAEWQDQSIFSRVHGFGINTQNETIQAVIGQYNSGWIVFDKIWVNQLSFDPFQAFAENSEIEYVGLFGDIYLWRWTPE